MAERCAVMWWPFKRAEAEKAPSRECSWCQGPVCLTCDRTMTGKTVVNGRYCSSECSEKHRVGEVRVPVSFSDFLAGQDVAGDEGDVGWKKYT